MNKKFLQLSFALLWALGSQAQSTANFENLPLSPNSYSNGNNSVPLISSFSSGLASFVNSFDTSWGGYWGGFAYSNMQDSVNGNFMNQYASMAGGAFSGNNYAVAYQDFNPAVNKVILNASAKGNEVNGFYICNSTWAYKEMLNGGFGKKYGGSTGNDPDFFAVHFGAWLNGNLKSDTATFYLADFRDNDNSKDYIVKSWTWFDLKKLGNVDSLYFWFSSSDTSFGNINTPTYFCMDNFITADAPQSISADMLKNGLKLYPNPCAKSLHVQSRFVPQVYDIYGRAIPVKTHHLTDNTYQVDCSTLPSAMYNISTSFGMQRFQKL